MTACSTCTRGTPRQAASTDSSSQGMTACWTCCTTSTRERQTCLGKNCDRIVSSKNVVLHDTLKGKPSHDRMLDLQRVRHRTKQRLAETRKCLSKIRPTCTDDFFRVEASEATRLQMNQRNTGLLRNANYHGSGFASFCPLHDPRSKRGSHLCPARS